MDVKLKDIPVRYFGKTYGILENRVEESHKLDNLRAGKNPEKLTPESFLYAKLFLQSRN